MAESTLSLKLSDIRTELADQGGWNATTEQTRIDRAIKAGLRMFYGESDWGFLRPTTYLTTSAEYTTGTITVASGVVTGASTTFPAWAAQGELTVGGVTYEVNTRDTATQLTLEDLTVTAAALSTYTLARPTYELPADFGELIGEMTYRPGSDTWSQKIVHVSEQQLREMRAHNDTTGSPRWCATRWRKHANQTYSTGTVTIASGVVTLAAGTFPTWADQGELTVASTAYEVSTRDTATQVTLNDTTVTAAGGTAYSLDRTGTRAEAILSPRPDAAYKIYYRYEALMDALANANDYPAGGQKHSQTILAACRVAFCRMFMDGENLGMWLDDYQRQLEISKRADSRTGRAEYLGMMSGGESAGFSDNPVVPGTNYSTGLTYTGLDGTVLTPKEYE